MMIDKLKTNRGISMAEFLESLKQKPIYELVETDPDMESYPANSIRPHPSLKKDKGIVNIEGVDIPIITWGGDYEDYSNKVIDSFTIWNNDLDFWEVAANFKMEDVAPIVSAFNSIARTAHRYELELKTLVLDGEKRMLLVYNDNRRNPIKIYGTGPSTMTKVQAESDTPTYHLLNSLFNSDSIYIDEKHLAHPESGYIYIENGKMTVQPLRFKDDKLIYKGDDKTDTFFTPYVLEKEISNFFISALEAKGFYLDLN